MKMTYVASTSHHLDLANTQSTIDRADAFYYSVGGKPIMSDDAYDALKKQLKQLNPDDIRLTRVGVPYVSVSGTVQHTIPMGSLDNLDDSISGFAEWYDKTMLSLGVEQLEIVAMHKLDGNSAAAYYEKGQLQRILSRGNGLVGEDITSNGVRWQKMQTVLPTNASISVRGEIMLFTEEFNILNADGVYANARNTASGIVGRLDGTDNELLRFVAFNMTATNNKLASMTDRLKVLDGLGFETVEHKRLSGSRQDVIKALTDLFMLYESDSIGGGNKRQLLPYEIDGIVIAINNIGQQKALIKEERDELRPKHSRAIKFKTLTNSTTILGCDVTLGHTGLLAPTACLKPVHIGGVTVDSALLTNWNDDSEYPSAAHVAIGDVVEVQRSGDVIPKIIRIIDPVFWHCGVPKLLSEINDVIFNEKIDPPKHCEIPGAPYVMNQEYLLRKTIEEPKEWLGKPTTRVRRDRVTANTYAQLDESQLILPKLQHYIGNAKRGVGILGIGDSILEALVASKLTVTPADLYKLKLDDLKNLVIGTGATGSPIKLGVSRANSILKEIEKSKKLSLDTFLGSLGVDLLGRRRVQIIAREQGLNTLEKWLDADQLKLIPGDLTQKTIAAGLEQIRPIIDELLSVGVEVSPIGRPSDEKSDAKLPNVDTKMVLAGVTMCFTGTRELLEEAEAAGAIIKSGVSSKLQVLVQKDATSQTNKTKQAESFGVKIIGIETLRGVLDGTRTLSL